MPDDVTAAVAVSYATYVLTDAGDLAYAMRGGDAAEIGACAGYLLKWAYALADVAKVSDVRTLIKTGIRAGRGA